MTGLEYYHGQYRQVPFRVGNIDKGGKVTEMVVYANYIGLHRFYQHVVNIGKWTAYEGGQLDRFHCTSFYVVTIIQILSMTFLCSFYVYL